MVLPTIKLKPQRPERLGHPWVYDNEIAGPPQRSFTNGGMVQVLDSRNRQLGVGYANLHSKIAIRYLTRRQEDVTSPDFWKGRITAAHQYRMARYAGSGGLPGAYRLVHGEADGLPGLIVDIYKDFGVVQFLALGLEPWRDSIINAVHEAAVRGIYERSDSPVRRLEGLTEQTGVLWGDAPPDILSWEDSGATILANVKNGAKTGLFLDQQENQKTAARQAVGRDVLNCFSYTGLFGIRAAHAGANSVTDVEISPQFNALCDEHWSRSSLTVPHTTVTENVFDYLRALEAKRYKTDMIILDPPAFTKNRASREPAMRGYNEINRLALRMLRPDGVLVTCSCSHHLTMDEFQSVIEGAARDCGRTLRLIERRGQSPDHPILLNAPESEYLKCLILAVE